MQWLTDIIYNHSALQAVIVISVIIAAGLGLGKLKIFGISLGVTFVFFTGILAGHLGLSVDPGMLDFAQSFGLILFVYELGLKVGPGFFSSFRHGGIRLNLLCLTLILLGTATAIGLAFGMGIPMSDMVGILSGATTNTPALGAAQQTLQQIGQPSAGAALSCAVTYPLGVLGVIIAIALVRRLYTRQTDLHTAEHDDGNHTWVGEFTVLNPGIFGKTIRDVAQLTPQRFVISRLWRAGGVSIPTSETELAQGDRLLVVSTDKSASTLTMLFGEREAHHDWNKEDIDWNAIDSSLISKHIIVSRPEINGKRLGSLRLRNSYGINITRVTRAGVQLLASPALVLQLGDRLTVVGEQVAIENVEKVLGNEITDLKEPNLAAIFIGLVAGLLLGSLPIMIPGMNSPIRLGLAGGPIIMGILIGRFGPQFHLVTYTTRSANLMLRGIGLSLFLACLGLSAGADFVDTIMQAEGLTWIGTGFIITLVPSAIMLAAAMRIWHLDFGSACGMVCGAMANPMAMNYSQETTGDDAPAVSYATVYPLTMFARVIIAQVLILIFA
ncbi:MAG: putative transporter [Muribaculaceae bacterium]|nr:putative transporter [Muribaculaceae bacterium]MDE6462806.1 putative transporter [Muribaculaceae bacterium]